MSKQHILFKTKDADAPLVIMDRNGEVCLDMCRLCRRAEIELEEPCDGRPILLAEAQERKIK